MSTRSTSPARAPGTVGLREGNAAANRTALTGRSAGLAIAAGSDLLDSLDRLQRFRRRRRAGRRRLQLTPRFVDVAPSCRRRARWRRRDVALNANVTVTFSEAVNVDRRVVLDLVRRAAATPRRSRGPDHFTLDPDRRLRRRRDLHGDGVRQPGDRPGRRRPARQHGRRRCLLLHHRRPAGLRAAGATYIHDIQGSGAAARDRRAHARGRRRRRLPGREQSRRLLPPGGGQRRGRQPPHVRGHLRVQHLDRGLRR